MGKKTKIRTRKMSKQIFSPTNSGYIEQTSETVITNGGNVLTHATFRNHKE